MRNTLRMFQPSLSGASPLGAAAAARPAGQTGAEVELGEVQADLFVQVAGNHGVHDQTSLRRNDESQALS
jgi:hypothetical protein